jgi:eukaryotic-like serine/threonine-protein kinase
MHGAMDHAVTAEDATQGRLVSGRYRLQEPIGRGAMGVVWRGRDELLDREIAVKEVRAAGPGADAGSEGVYQRTLREAKAAARLNHPGVVTVFDVVEEDGGPWIVMELVPARSLDRMIAEDGPLRPLQAARVGEHLVSALACAHAAGVLHRDVKPANVLLGPDGRTVLTDFGIATLAGDAALTAAGMVFGTPGFTAPERLRGQDATPASDLWSLGATLYAAVEGRGPFDRPGGSSAITAGVVGEPAPRAPSAGPLGPVIDALLRSDPGERPDAAAAARMLADAAAEAEAGWPPPAGIPAGYGAPAFGDVREFPDLAFPAELPTSVAPPGLGGPEDLPAFLDQPPFLDQADFPGQPGWPGPPGAPDPGAPAPGAPAPSGSAPSGGRVRTQRSGRRARVAALAAVAVAVAALAGWLAYPRPGGVTAASGSAKTASGSGTGTRGAAGSAGQGATASGTGGSGAAPATGMAAPAGYRWYQVTAASSGTAAGFRVAVPAAWTTSRQGLASYLRPPSGSGYVEISLAPFAYARPLREAAFLQAEAIGRDAYPGYRPIAIRPGTLLGAPDAAWRFSWQDGATRTEVLVLLLSMDTASGTQPYALAVSAPAGTFPATAAVLREALGTFRPLP